jgi:hypothetical protein
VFVVRSTRVTGIFETGLLFTSYATTVYVTGVLTVALVGPDNSKELTPDGDGVGDGVGAPLDLLNRYAPPIIAVTVTAPITIAVSVFILITFFIFCHFLILLK